MERCEHYTLDCKQEDIGCKGCAFYKKIEINTTNNLKIMTEKYKRKE